MLLQPCPISSKDFSFKKNMFSAEASEIGRKIMNLGRVYDDAADLGFTIISEKTGKGAVFAVSHVLEDEGDVLAWEFVCVTPGLKHLKAVIYND